MTGRRFICFPRCFFCLFLPVPELFVPSSAHGEWLINIFSELRLSIKCSMSHLYWFDSASVAIQVPFSPLLCWQCCFYFLSTTMLSLVLSVLAASALLSDASPLRATNLLRRQSITQLSTTQISKFKPFTFFASAAYCDPSTTIDWSCGGQLLYSIHDDPIDIDAFFK